MKGKKYFLAADKSGLIIFDNPPYTGKSILILLENNVEIHRCKLEHTPPDRLSSDWKEISESEAVLIL